LSRPVNSRSAGTAAALVVAAVLVILLLPPPEARAAGTVRLPAVGEALSPRVKVFARPSPTARRIAVMKAFRFDYRPTVFMVTRRLDRARRGAWYRVEVPGRPNGRRGWVRQGRLRLLRPAGPFRIVIDRSSRKLRLLKRGRTVLRAPVAVGTPDAPTPLGDFYVTAKFSPADDFLGPRAFETSAYAAITDWPRGGIVGLHGTSDPGSIGRRASHGCIRTYNRVILRLSRVVRPGTRIRIVR
jgi:lipoprotein-anchoring transpeptidase ErfK/SrfK